MHKDIYDLDDAAEMIAFLDRKLKEAFRRIAELEYSLDRLSAND